MKYLAYGFKSLFREPICAFCSWITKGIFKILLANAVGAEEKPPTENTTFILFSSKIFFSL